MLMEGVFPYTPPGVQQNNLEFKKKHTKLHKFLT
jgi:hypothetical protein